MTNSKLQMANSKVGRVAPRPLQREGRACLSETAERAALPRVAWRSRSDPPYLLPRASPDCRPGAAQLASIFYEPFFTVRREALFFEEAVCLRALAVAKQHDFRAIRLNAEMFHVYFQNKQKIMRIRSYFFDPIFSDIYRRIWSNCANELTVKAR
jgi:hypothetical protein